MASVRQYAHVAYTVWAAPGALRGFLHVRIQADHVVCSGTGVTQDDLSTLLANLTVVLVVCLIAVTVLCFWVREKTLFTKTPPDISHLPETQDVICAVIQAQHLWQSAVCLFFARGKPTWWVIFSPQQHISSITPTDWKWRVSQGKYKYLFRG